MNLLLSEQSNVRQKRKDCIVSQQSAIKALQKWSQGEHPAIQDVLHQTGELEMLLVDSQRDFVVALKEYKRVYEHILEMEKKLDLAKKQMAHCMEKEAKMQKEVVKGAKDPELSRERLKQLQDSTKLAEAEVDGQQRETELYKLMSLRAGLLDLSSALESVGKKTSIVAQAQRELAALIPEVNTRQETIPEYIDARDGIRILCNTKAQIEQNSPSYSTTIAFSPSTTTTDLTNGSRSQQTIKHKSVARLEQQDDSFDSFESD
ncbi:hypothetical protein EMCRGX_G023742 [Ephydatia muelleri]